MHRKTRDLLSPSAPSPGSGLVGWGPQGSEDQGQALVPWTKGQIPGSLGGDVLGSCPTQPAPPHPPRPRPAHTASSQVHQLNAEVTWTLCLLPGPGKLKALHSSQVMGEAEACLPGQPTLVPARQTGWRQGPAGDCGTDLRGWVG